MKNLILSAMWSILGRKELKIDLDKCVKCGKCAKLCPHHAIILNGDHQYMIQNESCIRCYHCKENCPKQAIMEK